jgi:hypothetical protein
MNKLTVRIQQSLPWVAILLLIVAILPLLALSGYNHPSPVDDYCYIDTVFKYSWTEAMYFYYTGWTGRYFSILLNHTNPLLFHWIGGFKVIPPFLIIGIVASLFLFFRHALQEISLRNTLTVTGIIVFLYILAIPSPAEAFYWMAAFATYTFANIFTLLWIVSTANWYHYTDRSKQRTNAFLSYFFLVCIIGSSETNLLVICLLLGSWWLYRLLYDRTIDRFMISSTVLAIICLLIFFLAPGNTARLEGNPLSGNIPMSAIASFKKLAQLLWTWSNQTPLLFLSVIWWWVSGDRSLQPKRYLKAPFWLVALLYIGILTAQLFPSYYGIGIEPTPRVINCVYFFFLVGWFYIISLLKAVLSRQAITISDKVLLALGIVTLALPARNFRSITQQSTLTMLYQDWTSGKAAAYDQEMQNRYATIQSSTEKVVTLPAIENRPQSLFIGDIGDSHWWIKCTSGYFGKENIHIK